MFLCKKLFTQIFVFLLFLRKATIFGGLVFWIASTEADPERKCWREIRISRSEPEPNNSFWWEVRKVSEVEVARSQNLTNFFHSLQYPRAKLSRCWVSLTIFCLLSNEVGEHLFLVYCREVFFSWVLFFHVRGRCGSGSKAADWRGSPRFQTTRNFQKFGQKSQKFEARRVPRCSGETKKISQKFW